MGDSNQLLSIYAHTQNEPKQADSNRQMSYTLSHPVSHTEVIVSKEAHNEMNRSKVSPSFIIRTPTASHINTNSYTHAKSTQIQASSTEALKVATAKGQKVSEN